ncbi:RsfS/YbeB/iojap family protein, partial [Escherichia coli]
EASDWIVVDLGEVIVHVMQEESRRLYELEKLWS